MQTKTDYKVCLFADVKLPNGSTKNMDITPLLVNLQLDDEGRLSGSSMKEQNKKYRCKITATFHSTHFNDLNTEMEFLSKIIKDIRPKLVSVDKLKKEFNSPYFPIGNFIYLGNNCTCHGNTASYVTEAENLVFGEMYDLKNIKNEIITGKMAYGQWDSLGLQDVTMTCSVDIKVTVMS